MAAGPSTASILIVGEEVLAGHTLDTNSHWLAGQLRERGVRVTRIETVPDDVTEVASTLKRHLGSRPTFVLVVGGIGPTPDDRTYTGVGLGLGRPLVADPAHVDALVRRARGAAPASEALQRMVRIPDGARALANPTGWALGSVTALGPSSVVVLPGVPTELRAMFLGSFAPEWLRDARPVHVVREVETHGEEARLWKVLTDVGLAEPAVAVGSYPQADGRIVLRFTGPPAETERATTFVKKFLANE